MQKIELIHYTPPRYDTSYTKDRQYHVFLNDKTVYFKSRKTLLAWLADVNRQLNTHTHALNRLTGELAMEYRYYFFHMDQAQRQVLQSEFEGLDRLFGLLVTRSQSANGNSFTFDRLHKICDTMLRIVRTLDLHPMNKLATVQRYRLASLEMSVKTARIAIDTLPDKKQNLKV